ncbi:ferritin [Spirosomataceae bacterium TFI 002]|nr:ferritin [Spirosomataceae bacterium TFI 002]
MISKKMEQMLNDQYNKEVYSANLYLSMSSYFLDRDLDGFANYFLIQSKEELMHAEKQFNYVHEIDGKITIQAIAAPPATFDSMMDCFVKTLEHEKYVTKSIYDLVEQALAEKDFATHTFLQWFVTEQVEEEATVKNLIKKLEMIGDNSSALFLLNDELLRRTLDAPAV